MLWIELPAKIDAMKLWRAALGEHITILPGRYFLLPDAIKTTFGSMRESRRRRPVTAPWRPSDGSARPVRELVQTGNYSRSNCAINSISTATPLGRLATPTVVRA